VARLLDAHGLRPDTDLGQHFLLDENLADLAVREGRVGPGDVVLEVGAGVGVLTRALAAVADRVHAVEIDTRLEPALAEALAGLGNVSVIWGDAMDLELEALAPPPTRMVANLPYDIATPVVLETIARIPQITRWCVMVQREVADRWTASPGSKAYGAATVQLALTVAPVFRRPVGREVFMPRPRVDSTLIALERIAPPLPGGLRALIRAAFAHRRKTLATGLGMAGANREAVRRALDRLDLEPTSRSEALEPRDFVRLYEELSWPN
jgi:16S rRNA (adenine1518-N6/adenine1519-N6)-dimethyltransferase